MTYYLLRHLIQANRTKVNKFLHFKRDDRLENFPSYAAFMIITGQNFDPQINGEGPLKKTTKNLCLLISWNYYHPNILTNQLELVS